MLISMQSVKYTLSRAGLMVIMPVVAIGLQACSDNLETRVVTPPVEDVVWKVKTVEKAITLALNGTQQLTPQAINLNNESIPVEISNYTFASADKELVSVTEGGLVTANSLTPDGPVEVYVSLRRDNVFRIDTVFVSVTPTETPIKSFSLVPFDSTRHPAGFFMALTEMIDENDNPVWGLNSLVTLEGGGTYMSLGSGMFLVFTRGDAWVYAMATAYGRTFKDSVKITFTFAPETDLTFFTTEAGSLKAEPGINAMIPPCGSVRFNNTTSESLIVALEDPSSAGSCVDGQQTGDVGTIAPGQTVTRTFPNGGVYKWNAYFSSNPAIVALKGTVKVE